MARPGGPGEGLPRSAYAKHSRGTAAGPGSRNRRFPGTCAAHLSDAKKALPTRALVVTAEIVRIEFDPDRDFDNRVEHGAILATAVHFDLSMALVNADRRYDYEEKRFQALGYIRGRLHMMVFAMRPDVLWAISLRKAFLGEVYAMAKKLQKPPPDLNDSPGWTAEKFAEARPFKEVFPEPYDSWEHTGHPPETAKVHVSFRLEPDLVNHIRATGKGYNARVVKVLRDAIAKGEL
jgi:uncharacterized DUF497 family protein/uncharacterized protein (DUF4415 family)